jgi:nitroimidazol reductase NimA-like FMN-containing flavoprotein (pyridoxamine 5'-phosphate oxidase superfamily)
VREFPQPPAISKLSGEQNLNKPRGFEGTLIANNQAGVCLFFEVFSAMFIHEMTVEQCRTALENANIGRLACARDGQPYAVPINFAFDGTYIYGFTTVGQKIEWMRANPLVCLEVDEIKSQNEWISIVVFGRYEELPDKPEFENARNRAYSFLQERAMWWEPAYITPEHPDQTHSLTPIFYRIHIKKITGHRATSHEPSPRHNAESCA